ncbi:MAG TPA: sigma-70 family RNA polymerase sigma factor [Labilithrix sp.]|jgi:RNA polymerase sigma-70 factor (ECF subfamily)
MTDARYAADQALVCAIQAGDRDALGKLVAREHSWLVRLARAIVKEEATAEEVVQDSWIAVIRALGSYEGRSSLRTWMATIVLNRAKTIAVRGARTVVLSFEIEEEESVDGARFSRIGTWSDSPLPWTEDDPEALLRRREVLAAIGKGMAELPEPQRAVLTLRDLEGWSSEEVCNALGVSESNQRVLLHRARTKIRAILEGVLGEAES